MNKKVIYLIVSMAVCLTTSLFIVKKKSFNRFIQSNQDYEIRLDVKSKSGTPGSMYYVTPKNVGDYKTSFSADAAQIIDAYRFTNLGIKEHGLKTSVMALTIMGQFLYSNEPLMHYMPSYGVGGSVSSILKYVQMKGSVLSEFSMSKCALKPEVSKLIEPTFKFTRRLNEIVKNKIMLMKKRGIQNPEYTREFNSFLFKVQNGIADEINATFASGKDFTFFQIPTRFTIQKLLDFHPFYYWWIFANYQCINDKDVDVIPVKLPRIISKSLAKLQYSDFINFIDTYLKDEQSLPISISFCMDVLQKDKNYVGKIIKNNLETCQDGDEKTDALIIGRRVNKTTQEPQVLIRKSWGQSCVHERFFVSLPTHMRKYSNEWFPEDSQNANLGKPRFSKDWECDKGNVWIDIKSLYANSFEVTFLK